MLKVIEAPEEDVVTVEDAVQFMRIDDPSDAEESEIETLITASRQSVEEYLRRAVGVQTLELRQNGFPSDSPILLRPPFIDIVSIKYLDSDREEITLDEDEYFVSEAEPAELSPVNSWPSTFNSADSVRIQFRAGYQAGESPALSQDCPKTIKLAILMHVADLYANRESQVEKPLSLNPAVERLISTYRLEMGI